MAKKKRVSKKPILSTGGFSSFRFSRHVNVGSADAVDDRKFLQDCFFDNGELDVLRDTSNNAAIIVGRTGSGKTALIEKILAEEERSVKIHPDQLALAYLSDNQLFRFFTEIGIKLDPFFNYLWKHIFITELVQLYKRDVDRTARLGFLSELIGKFKKRKYSKEAIKYLEDYGDKFWLSTEKRVKEEVKKYEQQMSQGMDASLKASIFSSEVNGGLKAGSNLNVSEEQKIELIRRYRK